jgi:PEP-CTERM putative exosortase interaction domain
MMIIIAVACSSHAATMGWRSGVLKAPKDAKGTYGDTNIGGSNSAAEMTIWFFSSLADAQAFVANGYSVTGTKPVTPLETRSDDSFASMGGGYGDTTTYDFTASATYYTVGYIETTITGDANPALNNTWYMYSDIGEFTIPGTGTGTLNFLSGSGFTGGTSAGTIWAGKWTAVPEPATAALVLAGLALLIRRRK